MLALLFTLFLHSAHAESIALNAYADFIECRHSLRDRCATFAQNTPDLAIRLVLTSPGFYEGRARRDFSQLGLSAILELIAQKQGTQYWLNAHVIDRAGATLIPWMTLRWTNNANFQDIKVSGPTYTNVDADLYRADLFMAISRPRRAN